MSYNTYGVRRMDSFAKAKKHFESVVPIRGDVKNTKPLGNRRYYGAASIEMPDADTVDLIYFGNTLVRWKADDTFTVFHSRSASAYGPDNMTPYLPASCSFSWNLGRLFINLPGAKTYLIESNKELRFQMVEGQVFMLNKPVAYSYRIKRTPLAKVMKEYEPFLSWLQVVLAVSHPISSEECSLPYESFVEEAGVKSKSYYRKLIDESEKRQDVERHQIYAEQNKRERLPFAGRGAYGANSKFHKPSCELLHQWVVDESAVNWAKAMYVIQQQAAEARYKHDPSLGGRSMLFRTLRIEVARDYLRHLGIFLNRDDVLERERMEDGEAPSKRNTNYFTEINFVL